MTTLAILSIMAALATSTPSFHTTRDIAICESQLGRYKTNWEGSGAYGLFQFKKQTWDNYCEGDIRSDRDQTICFLKLYPRHPNWWACKV